MRPNGQPRGPQVRGEVSGSALTILLTVMFVNMIGFGIIVPLLPFFAESFHAASWQVALIFSAYSVGAFFGEPFWGRLSDRWGRKPVLMLTVCGNCACYLALAFAPSIGIAFHDDTMIVLHEIRASKCSGRRPACRGGRHLAAQSQRRFF